MNAGAYGGEMKDVLKEVTVMTAAGRNPRTSGGEAGQWDIRTSLVIKQSRISGA